MLAQGLLRGASRRLLASTAATATTRGPKAVLTMQPSATFASKRNLSSQGANLQKVS